VLRDNVALSVADRGAPAYFSSELEIGGIDLLLALFLLLFQSFLVSFPLGDFLDLLFKNFTILVRLLLLLRVFLLKFFLLINLLVLHQGASLLTRMQVFLLDQS
jgi:hypothetical protein